MSASSPAAGQTVQALAERVVSYRAGAAVSAMIMLGDRLGLYRAMRGAGPIGPQQLVDRLSPPEAEHPPGIRLRWLREWLQSQVSAGLIERVHDGRYLLTEAGAAVLADEGSLASQVGAVATVGMLSRQVDAAVLAFQSGRVDTRSWDDPQGANAVDRARRPWITGILVPLLIPSLEAVADRLTAGARVADLCCGSALALRELAAAYPRSEFVGYDTSAAAAGLATELAQDSGLSNVTVRRADARTVSEDGPFDLLLTLDAMHELPHPAQVAEAARAAISDGGVWLIEDPRAVEGTVTDSAMSPLLAAQYATSVLVCLPRTLPEAGDQAVGAIGFTEELARQVTADAGFAHFRTLEVGSFPYHLFEVRP